jgi:Asp-tRNA(Asn)/Glu-tRNA(Gln) amidotransferase B subunit
MEHIVQFAIGIDDEAIRNRIAGSAEKQITDNIQKDVERIIFNGGWNTGNVDKNSPKEWVKDIVKDVIEANKDQIIEAAVVELAKNMAKTKAVKEAMTKVVGE